MQTQYLLACLASIPTIHKWVHNYFPGQCGELHKQTTRDITVNFNKTHHRINRTGIQTILTVAAAPLGYSLFTHFYIAHQNTPFSKKLIFNTHYHFRLMYTFVLNVYSSSNKQHNSVIVCKAFFDGWFLVQLARSTLANKNCHKSSCDVITPIKRNCNFHTSFYIHVPELSLVASQQFVKD